MPTVLLFAAAREAAGSARLTCDGETVADVINSAVRSSGTDLEHLVPYCSVMLDGNYISDTTLRVTNSSEIALLPPVSGGAL